MRHFLLFACLLWSAALAAQTSRTDIDAFKKQNALNPPKTRSILFAGSSSFTYWIDYQASFPDFDIINRGFGGSTLAEQMTYYEDVIKPCRPRQIVLYCGENDFAQDEQLTPKAVFERFRLLFEKTRKDMPDVQFSYVSMKPSPARQHLMPKFQKANHLIKKYLARQPNTAYIDVFSKMVNADGRPKSELFLEDSLHLNAEGYKIWKNEISKILIPHPKDKAMNLFIRELMEKMTLEEKIGQLNLITPGWGVPTGSVVSTDVEEKIKSGKVGGMFGVIGVEKVRQAQQLAIQNSRLKIPLLFGSDVIHGYKSTFPIPLGISCTWDIDLIQQSARMAALEATADGLNWAFSPMVDICRDPRWGRIAEGSGEDPYLGSRIAQAMVKGYQGDDLSQPNTLMACVKHFALYGAAEAGREYNSTDMSRQRMFNDYFPPYKAAVDAGVWSVMTSFNDVEGIPATGNKWLLDDVLRKRWGFTGMVISDYTSLGEMMDHGMGNLQEVSALALKAGLDMDMVSEGYLTTLKKSLNEGKIAQTDIDKACRRVLEAKYRLGLFDDPYRYCDDARSKTTVLSPPYRAMARDLAAKSCVLLKNDRQALPLKKSGSIALVGPLADSRINMNGTWAVSGDYRIAVTIKEGIEEAVGNAVQVRYAKGANITDDPEMMRRANVFGEQVVKDARTPEAMIEEALAQANASDVVVAVVGEAADMSGEASSRTTIGLPESQKALLKALAGTGKPVVMVLLTGRPLTLEWENDQMTAILNIWFGGMETGHGIADVLFGSVNPGGKLTTTFPRSVGQIPIYYNARNTGRPQDVSRPNEKFRSNYLDESNLPLYPFGYGLSYTTFAYSDLTMSHTQISGQQTLTASVTLTNTGLYDGSEVVQLYLRDMAGSVTRPLKELKGFQKIFLKAGESRTVSFNITPEHLKFYNYDLNYDWEAGDFTVMIGSDSGNVKSAVVNWKK